MNKSGKYDIVTVVGVVVSVIALVAILIYRPGMPKSGQPQATPTVQTPAAPAQQPSTPAQPAQQAQPTQQAATPEAPAQSLPQASQAENPMSLLAADVAQPRSRGTQGEQLLNAGDKSQMITSVDKDGNGVVSIELGEYLVDVPRKGRISCGCAQKRAGKSTESKDFISRLSIPVFDSQLACHPGVWQSGGKGA